MSDKKCSRCGNTIPEGKDECEQMMCGKTDPALGEKNGG